MHLPISDLRESERSQYVIESEIKQILLIGEFAKGHSDTEPIRMLVQIYISIKAFTRNLGIHMLF